MMPRMPTADIDETTSRPTLTSATAIFLANGSTENAVSAVNVEMHGANQNRALSESAGMISSLSSSLRASAMGWRSPRGPTRMGARRTWKSASTLRATSTMEPATRGKAAMITRVIRIGANKGLETMACILSLPHQRGLRQLQERLRVDAHDERQNAAHAQRQPQAEAGCHRGFLDRLAGKHAFHNLEIVINRHRHVQRGHHCQRVVPRLDQREENVVLPQEAGGRRDAGQREQEDQHQNRVAGALVHQAGEIVQVLADNVLAPQGHDHQKGA